MIKALVSICLMVFPFLGIAQNVQPRNQEITFLPTIPNYISVKESNQFVNYETTQSFLSSKFLNSNLSGQSLKLDVVKSSPVGNHIRFKHVFNNLEVYQSYIQANYSHEGKLYSVIDVLAKFDTYSKPVYNETNNLWINTSNGLVQGFITNQFDSSTKQPMIKLFSTDNQLIYSYSSRLYYHGPDSMVSAMVYLPNPIVAANTSYGGQYIDNNNKNNTALTQARSRVRVPLTFENGKFLMKGGFLTLKNLHDPVIQPVQPTDTFLNYTRDQSGFEDINAFYHMTTFSNYLRKTGFKGLLDSIYIDTHTDYGDDNSFFDPFPQPYHLEFSVGNVDDAEDGQVVIHEFGHSLSVVGSSGTAVGNERLSMEEGQADYVAMSYSRSLSKNKPDQVFSWDGHNEFWPGYFTNVSRTYLNLTGNTGTDREVWSTPLLCIYDKLGRGISDSLIFSYYFHQAPNTNMPQMARVILKMDSLLNKGRYVANIWQCFTDRKMLDTVPWYLVGIDPINPQADVKFHNTAEFANGQAAAEVIFRFPMLWNQLEIYNNLGQLVKVMPLNAKNILDPSEFNSGIYYVKIRSKDGKFVLSEKLVRF